MGEGDIVRKENHQDRQPEENFQQKKGSRFWTRFPVVFLMALICCILWGSAAPCIKIGYEVFAIPAGDTPARILFAGIRFTIAGAMVIAFESIKERRFVCPKRSELKYVAALAATQTVLQYVFFYMSLAYISGVEGSVLNASNTFFSIILAVFLFRFEKLTVRKVVGSVLGFAGVVLMVTGGSLEGVVSGFTLRGEGAMLLATFATALAGCLIKLFSKHADPVVLSGWQFFAGGIAMILIGVLTGGRLTFTTPLCIVLITYMGFISAGAYSLWGVLLKYNPVSTITILGFMNPVLSVLLSALLLGETKEAFNRATFGALALLAVGIIIVNLKGKKDPAAAAR